MDNLLSLEYFKNKSFKYLKKIQEHIILIAKLYDDMGIDKAKETDKYKDLSGLLEHYKDKANEYTRQYIDIVDNWMIDSHPQIVRDDCKSVFLYMGNKYSDNMYVGRQEYIHNEELNYKMIYSAKTVEDLRKNASKILKKQYMSWKKYGRCVCGCCNYD